MPLELISYQALCVVHRYMHNAVYRRNAFSGGCGVFWIVEACAIVCRSLGSGWLAQIAGGVSEATPMPAEPPTPSAQQRAPWFQG